METFLICTSFLGKISKNGYKHSNGTLFVSKTGIPAYTQIETFFQTSITANDKTKQNLAKKLCVEKWLNNVIVIGKVIILKFFQKKNLSSIFKKSSQFP